MLPTKLIYWDSCIFLAWLKDEDRPEGEMDGVYECVEGVERNTVRLITSVLTRTEVLEADLDDHTRNLYSQLLKRRNVQLVDNDLRVSNLAREIREYYREKPSLKTDDAIHLATAIHYRADAFYTFDEGKHGGRSLLSLNGNVAGYPLKVCKPEVTQYRLRLRV